MIMQQFLFIN